MVAIPDGLQVAEFLGGGDDLNLVALAGEHVVIVTAMARAYTRDSGFTTVNTIPECADELAAVITTATARLMTNPGGLAYDLGGTVSIRGGFTGWTLAELFCLNRYRKRSK